MREAFSREFGLDGDSGLAKMHIMELLDFVEALAMVSQA